MSINVSPIAAKDQGDLYDHLDSKSSIKWLNIRCHPASGTDFDEMSGNHGTIAFTGGASSHQWDTPGYFSGSPAGAIAGDRYYRDEASNNNGSIDNVARLDDLEASGGSLLIVFDWWADTLAPSANENIISFGRISAGVEGYWKIFNDTSGNIKCQIITIDKSAGTTNTIDAAKFTVGTRHTVGFLIDPNNFLISSYIDNASAADTDKDVSDLLTGWPAPEGTNRGLTIAALGTALSVADIFGTDSGRECRIGDILLIKDTSSVLSVSARSIVTRMYNEKGDLPAELYDL